MKRYDSYKDSGVQWIGEIPSHWEVARLKMLVKEHLMYGANEAAESDNKDFPRYIRITDIDDKGELKDETFKSLESEKAKDYLLTKGDVLFARSGATVGKTYLFKENYPACFAGYLIKATCDSKLNPSFLLRFTQSGLYNNWKNSIFIQSTIQNIGADKYNELLLTLPSFNEQTAIATYLDSKCTKIDNVIATQEKRVELLRELKQSIITRAVTRGINPNAKMKDSGVDSIGIIPTTWEVCKTLYVLSQPITDGPHETPQLFDEGIPFVSAEAVSCGNGRIDFDHIRGFISESYYKECCKKYIPQKGDVYMIKSGATTGKVSIVDTDRIFTIWSPLAAFRCNNRKMLPYFLFYALQCPFYQRQVELGWNYGTQQNIGMRTLEKLYLPVPTIDEQEGIVKFIESRTSRLDKSIDKGLRQIELLKEYKQSLITEVVTGKRKVC